MSLSLARRFAHLPRWLRVLLSLVGVAVAAALAAILFSVVAMGPDDIPALGPGLAWVSSIAFGVLAIAAVAVGDLVSRRVLDWDRQLSASLGFFQNHELTRLVGQSIGMILRDCEPNHHGADAALVRRLAARAESD
jgi:integral membrane sensor domain MASE1